MTSVDGKGIPARRAAVSIMLCVLTSGCTAVGAVQEGRIVIDNAGWQLVGDLRFPDTRDPVPAVLMLNKAADDRHVYTSFAAELAKRNIASLRLDLRGHGESVNLGRFVPGETSEEDTETLIWESQADVIAAHEYLARHPRIDPQRIGIVGASYSGEEMAEAGRLHGYARAYVALSPGSFSDVTIERLDSSGAAWLFVVSRHERHLHDIAASVQQDTEMVEILYVPGSEHATRILEARPDIGERAAVWLAARLRQ